jgi:hypothetical protein
MACAKTLTDVADPRVCAEILRQLPGTSLDVLDFVSRSMPLGEQSFVTRWMLVKTRKGL